MAGMYTKESHVSFCILLPSFLIRSVGRWSDGPGRNRGVLRIGAARFLFCLGGSADRVGFDRFEHDVAGSVLEAGKFDHGDMVTAGFQLETTQPIRQIFG